MARVDEQCSYAAGKGVAYRERNYHAVELDHPSTTGALETLDDLPVGNAQRRRVIFRDGVPHPKQIREIVNSRLPQNRGHCGYTR